VRISTATHKTLRSWGASATCSHRPGVLREEDIFVDLMQALYYLYADWILEINAKQRE